MYFAAFPQSLATLPSQLPPSTQPEATYNLRHAPAQTFRENGLKRKFGGAEA